MRIRGLLTGVAAVVVRRLAASAESMTGRRSRSACSTTSPASTPTFRGRARSWPPGWRSRTSARRSTARRSSRLRRPPEQAGRRLQHRPPVVRRRSGRHDRRRAELGGGARGQRGHPREEQGLPELGRRRPPTSPAQAARPTRCTGPTTPGRWPTAPARRWCRPAATPGSSSPPTMPSATRSSGHHRGGEGERRQGAGRRPPSAEHGRLLLLPAPGAVLRGQGDRPGQRRRRHHQLDQAGGRVRHRPERPEPGGPAPVPHRRARAGPAGGARA